MTPGFLWRWPPALKRIAVVLPRQGLGKIASEEIIGRFGKQEFVTRTFDSLDEALKWVAGEEKS